jgi:hypothetical protein
MGTPTESNWPGVSQFRDYKPVFPQWKPTSLDKIVSTDNLILDLLYVRPASFLVLISQKMLIYEPAKRINAKDSLKHPYFRPSYVF